MSQYESLLWTIVGSLFGTFAIWGGRAVRARLKRRRELRAAREAVKDFPTARIFYR